MPRCPATASFGILFPQLIHAHWLGSHVAAAGGLLVILALYLVDLATATGFAGFLTTAVQMY